MPNHTSNRLTVNGPTKERDKFIEENRGAEEQLSLEQALPTPPEALGSNKITNGSMPTWYNWRVENWGTKWDVYDTTTWQDDTIRFYSAWSPPLTWLQEVAKKYPRLSFELAYADEGGGFVGTMEAQGDYGEGISEYRWDSEEGIALRDDLGYYHPEDEED